MNHFVLFLTATLLGSASVQAETLTVMTPAASVLNRAMGTGPAAPSIGQAFERVADRAGIALTVELDVPFLRALRTASTSDLPVCVPFVVSTPERESVLRFTNPILPAEPAAILFRDDNATLAAHDRFDGVLRDQTLVLSKRDGLFYGTDVEQRLATFDTPTRSFSAGESNACALVARGRADYCISTADTLRELQDEDAALYGSLRAGIYADSPLTDAIRIGCSRATPEAVIEALNDMIAALD